MQGSGIAMDGPGLVREIARLREVLADFFAFENEYKSTELQWQKYVLSLNYAARMSK